MKTTINKKIFVTSLLILGTVLFLISTNLIYIQQMVDDIYDFCISQFGWLFVLTNICCLIFSLWIMFGPYKNVRLGGESQKPVFSTFSWAGMMFTTSCGAWLVVYGFLEPIYCAAQAPFQIEPLTTQAFENGQMYAHFHWGPNAWCIYVPASVAIGYGLYNRHVKSGTMGEVLQTSILKRGKRIFGFLVNLLSVFGTVIAPVISIGTGMPILVLLIENVFGISDSYRRVIQLIVLLIWVAIFSTSVYMGLKNGIKRLSNANMVMAFVFMLVFGIMVGPLNVFSAEINTMGLFLNNYVRMSTYTDPYGSGGFVYGWTMGYWACYFVYMPLMGVFNAKISRGRRLKEIAFGQLILCSLGCWVAMATFGNYSMSMQVNDTLDVAAFLTNGDEAGAILAILQTMPASNLFMIFLLIISFVFLATTMDSSAFAAAEMTIIQEDEKGQAPRWLRIVWAAVASMIAFVLLQVGGVKAVRSLCYMTGLPLAIITYLVMFSAWRMLKEDHSKRE